MGYYKTINGKNYDGELLELAEKSVAGKGDGRISLEDAKALLAAVKDSNSYTEVEKETMEYIRENYMFTAEADEWFRKEIRSWAAQRGAASKKKATSKKKSSSPKKPAAKKKTAKKKAVSKKKAVKKKPVSKKKASSKKKSR
jgi:hypothetical protein